MQQKIKEVEHWLRLQPGELKDLFIAVLVLAFCFGYSWEGPKTLGAWALNFGLMLILVTVSIAVHELAHRWKAAKHLARVRSKLFLSGAIAALVLIFITNGRFVFAALWAITISSIYTYRPGRPFPTWHLGPYERAQIAVIGPLANFGLAVIAKLFIPVFGTVAEKLMMINIWMAVINLFPFFTLIPILLWQMSPVIKQEIAKGTPYVEGEYVFFGSRSLWLFTFVFVIIGGVSLVYLGLLLSLLLAFMVASALYLAWHFLLEGARPKPAKP